MPLGLALLDALERMRYGGLILNGAGEVIRLNAAAERCLRDYAPNAAPDSRPDWTRALRQLLGTRAGHAAEDADFWLPIGNGRDRHLLLYSRRVADPAGGGVTVVMLVDPTEPAQPNPETLQKLFRLTPAEAALAVEMARGLSPGEAAEALGIKITTVRCQLSSIFAKTGTERQGELVALLSRLAVLP